MSGELVCEPGGEACRGGRPGVTVLAFGGLRRFRVDPSGGPAAPGASVRVRGVVMAVSVGSGCVGRVGVLAVALGIGVGAGLGLGPAAAAPAQDVTSSGGSETADGPDPQRAQGPASRRAGQDSGGTDPQRPAAGPRRGASPPREGLPGSAFGEDPDQPTAAAVPARPDTDAASPLPGPAGHSVSGPPSADPVPAAPVVPDEPAISPAAVGSSAGSGPTAATPAALPEVPAAAPAALSTPPLPAAVPVMAPSSAEPVAAIPGGLASGWAPSTGTTPPAPAQAAASWLILAAARRQLGLDGAGAPTQIAPAVAVSTGQTLPASAAFSIASATVAPAAAVSTSGQPVALAAKAAAATLPVAPLTVGSLARLIPTSTDSVTAVLFQNGPGQKRMVVFLSGVAPNLMSAGRSLDTARSGQPLPSVKNFIDAKTREWNPTEIMLVGHSHGGMQAQVYARSNPKVSVVVTLGSPVIVSSSSYPGSTNVLHIKYRGDRIGNFYGNDPQGCGACTGGLRPSQVASFSGSGAGKAIYWLNSPSGAANGGHDLRPFHVNAANTFDAQARTDGYWRTLRDAVSRFAGKTIASTPIQKY